EGRPIPARPGSGSACSAGGGGCPADLPARAVYEGDALSALTPAHPRWRSLRRHRRDQVSVAENLKAVRERIAGAGRNPDEITIVAVTKGFGADQCLEAMEAGLTIVGENRVQEALPKMELV